MANGLIEVKGNLRQLGESYQRSGKTDWIFRNIEIGDSILKYIHVESALRPYLERALKESETVLYITKGRIIDPHLFGVKFSDGAFYYVSDIPRSRFFTFVSLVMVSVLGVGLIFLPFGVYWWSRAWERNKYFEEGGAKSVG